MLCLHCKDVVKTLCLVEILNVCKWLKTLTADCLDNIQILRSKPPGNRQSNWMKKNQIITITDINGNITKRLSKVATTVYPTVTNEDFSAYDDFIKNMNQEI